MAKVLLLSIPSHGHMNPTLGLAGALVKHGEEVTFFSSEEFRKPVEATGATFICYKEDLNIFKFSQGQAATAAGKIKPAGKPGFINALLQPERFVDHLMEQIRDMQFDYIVHSAAYPYASLIAQALKIPAVSSFAVFATMKDFEKMRKGKTWTPADLIPFSWKIRLLYLLFYRRKFDKVRRYFQDKYKVRISTDLLSHFFNKGELNIIYTSRYFIRDNSQYDNSFIFVGAPVYEKKYQVDFPFEKLEGKKVLYISLGTVFGNYAAGVYELFFKAFADMDITVVMTAYGVDLSAMTIPANFIVRDYVPQSAILERSAAAITHAGMNSIGDLLYANVPFVSIPMGADQFFLAERAAELGATIALDVHTLTAAELRAATEKVMTDKSYVESSRKISDSFREAGGYEKAVKEIFSWKQTKGIRQ
ncbi:glycosyltransferase, MGT family [Chitinophaga sp. YR627]|uniref:macrolide family glycosyltransferase n=1 Tax=Chitinophaga sp. YR627 TaxID=1881041 RepID=UPI0008E1F537|nr:macrolide family glycosyltransferase [Chitinophaga sp. YR627]SFO76802.1 glycosyltransferase, MGT family [Chitinophaga sp. YR627]